MKTKFTFLLLFIFSIGFAQENTAGEIIISRENLISLLRKFKSQNVVATSSESSKKMSKTIIMPTKEYEFDSIQSKLVLLEKEIYLLNKKLDSLPKNVATTDTIFIERNSFSTDSMHSTIVVVDTVAAQKSKQYYKENVSQTQIKPANTYDSQLAELNRKYDQLLYNQSLLLTNFNYEPVESKSIVSNEKSKLAKGVSSEKATKEVKSTLVGEPQKSQTTEKTIQPNVLIQPKSTKEVLVVRDTVYVKSNPIVQKPETNLVYEKLVEKYGSMEKKIFFENNSSSIASINQATLFDIINVINQNNTVDVYLEGFASKKGNPSYNEKLSLERTEKVKQYLISKGIHPTRILSYYHGIDFNAIDDQSARRVDLTFIIRK